MRDPQDRDLTLLAMSIILFFICAAMVWFI